MRGNAGLVFGDWRPCLEEEGGKDEERKKGRSDYDCDAFLIDAVVVEGWLLGMVILVEPGLLVTARKVLRGGRHFGGRSNVLVYFEVMRALL